MTKRYIIVTAAYLCIATPCVTARTFVETFEGGSNVGSWSFPNGRVDTIELSGGNPGAFNRDADLATPYPMAWAKTSSPFTGDYQSKQVTSVGIDFVLLDVLSTVSALGGPVTVCLENDNGTPTDPFDDWGAYYAGNSPCPTNEGVWYSYDFEIPFSATSLPTGWKYVVFGPNSPTPTCSTAIVTR